MPSRLALIAVAGAFGLSVSAHAQVISSTFDTDTEGWGVFNDARDLVWTGAIGNPPGALRATDIGDGRAWYFAASSAYLGDMSAYFGEQLSWDIIGLVGNQTSLTGRADVILSSPTLNLGVVLGVQPVLNQWTSWQVPLSDAANWRVMSSMPNGNVSATVATPAQIQSVLSNLTGLYIRGEYTSGADSSAIDNVLLVPTPGAVALLGLAGLLAAPRRRRCRHR